jgi:NAD-dependent deacetylase
VLTQNVDGLHAEAGSSDIVELHGNIQRFKCANPCDGEVRYVDLSTIEYNTEVAPPCPHCPEGGFVRPDVVWFGEGLPPGALDRAVRVAQRCDAMLVVGTSGMVHPAASLPGLARESGALVVEVNPNPTPITPTADYALRGPSGQLLPQLVDAIRKERNVT